MLNVIRGIVMLVLYPVLHKCAPKGYAMGWKDMIVSLWGALRGAVGLALAMFIALKGKDNLKLGIRECRRMCEADALTKSVTLTLTMHHPNPHPQPSPKPKLHIDPTPLTFVPA